MQRVLDVPRMARRTRELGRGGSRALEVARAIYEKAARQELAVEQVRMLGEVVADEGFRKELARQLEVMGDEVGARHLCQRLREEEGLIPRRVEGEAEIWAMLQQAILRKGEVAPPPLLPLAAPAPAPAGPEAALVCKKAG